MYGTRPTTRLLSMLEILQSGAKVSGADLARRLEVGERTIRRYVVMLQEMGVPVEGERGRYGAYRLRPGYRLPPMMFTEDEALGLALSLMAARRLGLSGAAPAVEGALAKLQRVMPESVGERVRTLEGAISLAISAPEAKTKSEHLFTVAAAVGEKSRVRMKYRTETKETERDVDPYGVVNREGLWYFVGHCHLRKGLRLFRVDRILGAARTGEEFVRPKKFRSQRVLLDAVAATTGEEWSVEVLLKTTEDEVRWQLPKVGVSLAAAEGGVLLRCSTWDLVWIVHLLSGLSCDFSIIEPEELREELLRHAERLATLAKQENPRKMRN